MFEPDIDLPVQRNVERLREIENEIFAQRRHTIARGHEGARDYCPGWHENRMSAAKAPTSFPEPLNSWFAIVVGVIILAGWIYLLSQ